MNSKFAMRLHFCMNPNQRTEAKQLLNIKKCLYSEKLLFQIQFQFTMNDDVFICEGTHICALPIHKSQFTIQHDQCKYDTVADQKIQAVCVTIEFISCLHTV